MLAYKAKESVPSPDIVRLAEEDAHVVLAILQALGPAARDENGGIREEVGGHNEALAHCPVVQLALLGEGRSAAVCTKRSGKEGGGCGKAGGQDSLPEARAMPRHFPHLNFPLSSDSSFSLTCAPALPMIADIDPSPSPRWQQIASWPTAKAVKILPVESASSKREIQFFENRHLETI